ncbi:TonB-dependent receptor [Undibacterium sp. Di24W]|uniref:TonB-dependent receptor n=1 Tax=Undibacterium sp. Di24W TaxID=3413033 RepID=UPI003BF384DC
MKTNLFKSKHLQRSAISIAISFCFSSAVLAQSSEGSIFGRAPAKSQISITNLDTGAKRHIQAESDGSYTFPKLQPGRYQVNSGSITKEVLVSTGTGTEISLNDSATVVVTGSRTRSPIDMSSTENNSVFTAAEIQAMPVARNTTAVAMLTPGTVQGSAGLGNLASIGGASVAENAYYINGFDVTNIRNFVSYINLPFEAIAEQQVKTGGYGAQYGRSLGGVISMTTKSGTNTWKGGVSTYYNPESFLKAKPKNIVDQELYGTNKVPTRYISFGRENLSKTITNNAYLGGPIIKDKLFIFGLFSNSINNSESFGRTTNSKDHSQSPSGVIKIDFLPTADHRFEMTALSNKPTNYTNIYTNPTDQDYSLTHNGAPDFQTFESSSKALMGKYTGYITDNFNISAQVGKVETLNSIRTNKNQKGRDCPWVLDWQLNPLGCYDPNNNGSERDPKAPPDGDLRKSARLDLEYTWGSHTIRGGYDAQKFTTSQAGSVQSSGGIYYRYYRSTDGSVNNVPNVVKPGEEFVRVRLAASGSGVYDVINVAKFVEDSWKVSPDILVNTGLRWESFDNQTNGGKSFVKADNLLAPRIGAAWNVFGDGNTKVFGNIGRYFIPVASNTNVRATRYEYNNQRFYTFTGKDPRTAAPITLGPEVGFAQLTGSTVEPNPGTVADTKLKPMSQNEFIIGIQQSISKDLAVGIKFDHRKVTDGMDDFCGTTGIGQFMKEKGYTKFNPNTLATCVLMNPGRDLNLNIDVANNGVLVPVTIPNSYIRLAKYERTYNDMQLTLDRPFDGKWGLSGSYTYSRSRGSSEGYVSSNNDQIDAGVTSEFDFASLTDGIYGPTPNERTHSFKAFGTYVFNDAFSMGFNASLVSGRPITCLGNVPTTVWDYLGAGGTTKGGSGSYGSGYYCLNGQFDAKGVAQSSLIPRGSLGNLSWTKTFDISGSYKLKLERGMLTFSASIFNLFNFQTAQTINEYKDYSQSTQAAGRINKNYGLPTSYQSPRSARLSARYEF